MSIYGSLPAPDDDEHEDGCAVYREESTGVLKFSGDPCSCGQPRAPIIYQGSHVLPSMDDPRGCHVGLASISGFITRDGRDDGPNEDVPWPYLRFGVNESVVVLDRRGVELVYETLREWLKAVEGG